MRMAIPELHINPIDRIIKTVTGDLASVFIDFVPARQEDLAGPQDYGCEKSRLLHRIG